MCALYSTLSAVLTDRPDPAAIGAHNVEVWRTALQRLIEFRDAGHEHRFFDLAFEDVQRDPIAAVERLYAELGDDLSDEARRRMKAWWDESTRDRSGPGSYEADVFDLDLDAIREQFAFYSDRFTPPTSTGGRP